MKEQRVRVYKLSLRNYVSHWWILVLYLAVLAVVPAYLGARYGGGDAAMAFAGFAIWIAASFVPLLVLHTKYTLVSMDVVLAYNETDKEIEIATRTAHRRFAVGEIASIRSTKSRSLIKCSLLWFPWDSSCYAMIVLKDGQQFLITSLIVPWLQWPFEFADETAQASFFCWPPALTSGTYSRKQSSVDADQ